MCIAQKVRKKSTLTRTSPTLSLTTGASPSTFTCSNDAEYRYDNGSKKSCAWLMDKPWLRKRHCAIEEVINACPISCGLCCEDDPSFTFTTSAHKKQDCAWLAEDRAVRESKLCGNRSIRNNCALTCDNCQYRINVPDDDSVSTCEDDPSFNFFTNARETQNCAWIRENEDKRKPKYCKQTLIREHCTYICQSCLDSKDPTLTPPPSPTPPLYETYRDPDGNGDFDNAVTGSYQPNPTPPTSTKCHTLCCFPFDDKGRGGWADNYMLTRCDIMGCHYEISDRSGRSHCTGNLYYDCVSSTCYSPTDSPIKAPTGSPVSGPTDDCGSDKHFKVEIQNDSFSVLTYVVQKKHEKKNKWLKWKLMRGKVNTNQTDTNAQCLNPDKCFRFKIVNKMQNDGLVSGGYTLYWKGGIVKDSKFEVGTVETTEFGDGC